MLLSVHQKQQMTGAVEKFEGGGNAKVHEREVCQVDLENGRRKR
jgi:hypothetical protein